MRQGPFRVIRTVENGESYDVLYDPSDRALAREPMPPIHGSAREQIDLYFRKMPIDLLCDDLNAGGGRRERAVRRLGGLP